MPRLSARKLALKRLDEIINTCNKHINLLHALGVKVENSKLDMLLTCIAVKKNVENNRYFTRSSTYQKRIPKFEIYLADHGTHPDALSDDQFLFHFRVSRETFGELVDHIKNHSVFQRSSDARGPHQKPASHQLLVLLKCYGSQGNQACSRALGTFFGIGTGVVDVCRSNALEAILSLEPRTYFWPTPEERKKPFQVAFKTATCFHTASD